MKKKVLSKKVSILSLFLILIAGLAFIFYLNNLVNPSTAQNWQLNLPVTSNPVTFDLEINNPDDQTISFDKTILVSGQTAPGAVVLISTLSNDTEVDANQAGDFSKEITLDPGLNELYISSFDVEGHSKQVKRTIYYSMEQL